jgi:putative ABC transport system permease protein
VRLIRPAANIPSRFIPPDPAQSEVAIIFTAIDPRRSRQLDFYFAPDGGTHEEAIAQLEAGGAVLISSALREWYGLDVGDTMRLQTLQGPIDFRVAGVTLSMTANGYGVIGGWDDARRYFGTDRVSIFAVNLVSEADSQAASQRILGEWGDTYNLRIETLQDFRTRSRSLSESYFAMSNAAVLVGVLVAALGVVNTLLMNVLERRREIGMLRSLGMTRGQIVRLILSESAALGMLGGFLGVGLGAWLSRFAVSSSTSVSGFDLPFVFPIQAVVTCVFIAAVVPLLAGLWPAWRGARVNVIEALRNE